MKRFLYVSRDTLPIVAFAESRDAMRVYVRDLLNLPRGVALPRHVIVSIA